MKRHALLFVLIGICLLFCYQFFFKLLVPAPLDALVGGYHPFRDYYAKEYPRGVPFKNFIITDPVRQNIPWKKTVIDSWKTMTVPLWNPYEMTGKPLIGNIQSQAFYPLNIIFFLFPFWFSWSLFIVMQLVISVVAMYSYLTSQRLDRRAVFLGTISWVFSGFAIAWFEWGNIVHTACWLPLILLCIDKTMTTDHKKKSYIYHCVLLLVITASFFAGHLQTFFYMTLFVVAYTFFFHYKSITKTKKVLPLLVILLLFVIVSSVQWIPALQFISLSARSLDQNWLKEGWFVPWIHLIQFVIPDFFGNPSTNNYWGTWNYGEMVGFIGVVPLLCAFFTLFYIKDRRILFYSLTILICLLLLLPTPLAKLPYIYNVPFLSTAQPTRLMIVICLALSVLAAFGLQLVIDKKISTRKIGIVCGSFIIFFVVIFVLLQLNLLHISIENLAVTKRNSVFPFGIVILASILFFAATVSYTKKLQKYILLVLILLVIFDLFRFFNKYNSFSQREYFFPTTKSLAYITQQQGVFRVASTNSEILAPNIASTYKIQSIEGYDPLYLRSYAEFIAAIERNSSDYSPPYGYNRIITPRNRTSPLFDLLQVRYFFTFDTLQDAGFIPVYTEGKTKIYEDTQVLERAFFVQHLHSTSSKKEELEKLMKIPHRLEATTRETIRETNFSTGSAQIVSYQENAITIATDNKGDGFLLLLDPYYPSWEVFIDEKKDTIYQADYLFRGVKVPAGKHTVVFKNTFNL